MNETKTQGFGAEPNPDVAAKLAEEAKANAPAPDAPTPANAPKESK